MNLTGLTYLAEEIIIPLGMTSPIDVYNITNTSFTSGSGEESGSSHTALVSPTLVSTRFIVQTIVTPIVVTIGLVGNLFNILVLVQPSMRTSTNVYLLTLAVADSVYLVFTFALSFVGCRRKGLTHAAYAFNTYGRTISDIAGNTGVWIIVIFTVERFGAVSYPIYGKIWCTVKRAKLFSLLAVLFCLVNTVPGFFELEIVEGPDGPRCQYTAFANSKSYELGYTWWYVTIFTFVPFVFLLIFNSLLIRTLVRAARDRELMLIGQSEAARDPSGWCSCSGRRRQWMKCFCCGCLAGGGASREESVPAQVEKLCCGSRQGKYCPMWCINSEEKGTVEHNGRANDRATGCGLLHDEDGNASNKLREVSYIPCVSKEHPKLGERDQGMRLLSMDNSRVSRNDDDWKVTGAAEGARYHSREDRENSADRGSREVNGKQESEGLDFEIVVKRDGSTSSVPRYGATRTTSCRSARASPAHSRRASPAHSGLCSSPSLSLSLRHTIRCSRRSGEQNKVTLMLTVIVIIFLLCQLPWTVLYLYRAYLSAHNISTGSDSMKIAGNVVNLLAQFNASGNFYLYSFFSKRFRRTLARLFLFWKAELTAASVHL